MSYQPTASHGQQVRMDPVSRVAGMMALHADVDASGRVTDAVTMARTFRGYELILADRDVRDAIFISSRASGVDGGAHATCSALALEMILGVSPPQFGILVRNVLASLENMAENPVHLFTRVGPDFSEPVVRDTNPELWARAETTPAPGYATHGLRSISDIMTSLTRYTGVLYRESLVMSRTAREAYVLMGGKYPHPQTIVPGGISSTVDPSDLSLALLRVVKFLDYTRRVATVWDDLASFFYEADERYREVGAAQANFIDLGLWDDPEVYDGSYENANAWGTYRWATPGVVLNGQLRTTSLTEIDNGLEEFVDNSFYDDWVGGKNDTLMDADPLGNRLSARHPWNKSTLPQPGVPSARGGKNTWSTAPRWRREAMETGAYARLWITAKANKIPRRKFMQPTGYGMQFTVPQGSLPEGQLEWTIPQVWNAFERNRANAYALMQSTLVAYENLLIGFDLARIGGPDAGISSHYTIPKDNVIGVGYWGGARGYVSHHVEIDRRVIQNYQILAPSTFMAARDSSGAPSPFEQALIGTPSLSTQGHERYIDLQRAIRSFDPSMSDATH